MLDRGAVCKDFIKISRCKPPLWKEFPNSTEPKYSNEGVSVGAVPCLLES